MMIMKNWLFIPILIFTLLLSSYSSYTPPSLVAEIDGLGNDTILLFIHPLSEAVENDANLKQDTIVAKDNRFEYTVPYDGDALVYFVPNSLTKSETGRRSLSFSGLIPVMIKSGKQVKLKGKLDGSYIEYSTDDKGFNSDYMASRNEYKNLLLGMDSLNNLIQFYTMSPQAPQNQDKLIHSLFDKRNAIRYEQDKVMVNYMKKNLDKDLSGYYLLRRPTEYFIEYYDQLENSVKNGAFKVQLDKMLVEAKKYEQKIENESNVKAGETAPDFTLKDIEGNDFTLSSIKGKYIVLDFWGSWCGPCISGFPHMKEYYNKYKDKVEFVGIACKDKEDKWKNAVDKAELTWVQLINDPSRDVTVTYSIMAYPTKIILDENRKIIAFIRGESVEFYNKLDEILE